MPVIIGVTLDVSLHGVRGHHDDVVAMMSRPDPGHLRAGLVSDETNLPRLPRQRRADQVFSKDKADPIAVALDTLTGIGPILGLTIRRKWATSRASRAAPSWPVTPAWCRGWMPAPIDIGLAESRGKAHPGSMGVHRSGDAHGASVGPDGSVGTSARVRKGAGKARVACARVLCDDIVAVAQGGLTPLHERALLNHVTRHCGASSFE